MVPVARRDGFRLRRSVEMALFSAVCMEAVRRLPRRTFIDCSCACDLRASPAGGHFASAGGIHPCAEDTPLQARALGALPHCADYHGLGLNVRDVRGSCPHCAIALTWFAKHWQIKKACPNGQVFFYALLAIICRRGSCSCCSGFRRRAGFSRRGLRLLLGRSA